MKIFTCTTITLISSSPNELKQTQHKKESKLCSKPSPQASYYDDGGCIKECTARVPPSTDKSIMAKTATMANNTDVVPNAAGQKSPFEIKKMKEQKQHPVISTVATMTQPSSQGVPPPVAAGNDTQGRATRPGALPHNDNVFSYSFSTDDVVGSVFYSQSSPSRVTILTTGALPILLLLVEVLVYEPNYIKWSCRCVMNAFCVDEATTLWLWLYLYLYVMKVSCSASEICTFFYKSCFISNSGSLFLSLFLF
jgi:hypothetical protein